MCKSVNKTSYLTTFTKTTEYCNTCTVKLSMMFNEKISEHGYMIERQIIVSFPGKWV